MKAISGDRLVAAVLRALGDGLIACDPTGTVLMLNPTSEQQTGWTEKDARGRKLSEVLQLVSETNRQPVSNLIETVLKGESIPSFAPHALLVRRDGSEIAVACSVAPIRDSEGPLEGAVLLIRDVAVTRRAEWVLELLAETGRELMQNLDETAIVERIGRIAVRHFADFAIFDLFDGAGGTRRFVGPSRHPAQQESVAEAGRFVISPTLLHQAMDRSKGEGVILLQEINAAMLETISSGEPERIDYYRRLGLHSLIAVPLASETAVFGMLSFGRTVLGVSFDAADRIAAAELGRRVGLALERAVLATALEAERARLRAIIDNIPVGVLVSDPSGRIVLANGATEQIFRHPPYETNTIAEHANWISYHPDGRRVAGDEYPLPRAMASGQVIPAEEYLYQRGDGTQGWISLTAGPIFDQAGTVTGGVVAIQDIDAQRQAREILRQSEERNRQILSSTRDCIKVLDLQGNLLSMNEEGQQRLGIEDFSQVQGRCWQDFWGSGSSDAMAAVETAAAGGVGNFEGEFLTFQGERTWWDVTVTPIVDGAGRTTNLLAISRENTQRRLAELALRESEARFRRLIDQASVCVLIGGLDGAIHYMNRTMLDLLGYTEQEVQENRLRWDELTPPTYVHQDQSALKQLRATGRCEPYQKTLRARNGNWVPFLLGAVILDAAEGKEQVAVFLTDMTTQRRTEAALLESEKLAAVGKLASSISHEINNPLEAVTNLLYIVSNDPTLRPGARQYLRQAEGELQRVSQIVRQTLRFHRQSMRPTEIRPDILVDQVLALYAGRLSNYNIKVSRRFEPQAKAMCYDGDIRQVLNNLVGNACDSMRAGGVLQVRSCRSRSWTKNAEGIRITIADTGTGMTPAVQQRIFEAFFTTKEIHGTGLGLWISSQIVEKQGGTLRVRSSIEGHHHGSVFAVWLPLVPPRGPRPGSTAAAAQAHPEGPQVLQPLPADGAASS